MSPRPSSRRATPWARDRDPRWVAAGALATVLVLATLAWLPVDALRRLFGRDFVRTEEVRIGTAPEGIRLLPALAIQAPPAPSSGPRVARPTARPARPDPEPAPRHESPFVGDPTTAYDVAAELVAPAVPDSAVARGLILTALAQGRIGTSVAAFDTSRVAAARRQFERMDQWMNAVMRPLFEAEGRAARIADIYRRAVTEAEEEGM